VASGVVGLDLSLHGAAAAYLPPDWEPGDWATVQTKFIGYEGGDEDRNNQRLVDIVVPLTMFVARLKAKHVAIESYALSKKMGRAFALGEIGGAMRFNLAQQLGISAVTVNQMSLRSFFLGAKLPRGKGAVPKAVHAALKSLGVPWENADEADAMLAASYHRTSLGMTGLTLAR
jgi:Holliday junction resolvasome RuvABC endonuclease subunit